MNGMTATAAAVLRWQRADEAARAAKQEEMDARLALVGLAFPAPTAGTNSVDLGDGLQLKGQFKNNYKVQAGPELDLALKALPTAIRGALVKFKPELSVSAYNALEPAHQRIINEVITISPGTPALEIVKPKSVK